MENRFLKLTNTVYKVLEFFPEGDPLKNRAKDKALAIMDNLISINETSGWVSFHNPKGVKVQLFEDIDTLLGYLWIAKSQSWMNSVNCLIISNEYDKIKKEIEPVIELTKKLPGMDNPPVLSQSLRFDRESSIKSGQGDRGSSIKSGPENPQLKIIEDHINPVLDSMEAQKEEAPIFLNNISNEGKLNSFEIFDLPAQTSRQNKILDYLGKNDKAQVMDLQTVLPDITKRTIRRDLDELLENGRITRMGDFNQVFYQIKR